MDGARIFNALVETGTATSEIGRLFDSISVCFSKGLGAPVGSALLGPTEFINKSRRIRKVFGGGMRQSGILAAAAIYALDNNINRLKEDHHRAKQIETMLLNLPYVKSCMVVETNIIIFTLNDDILGEDFVAKAKEKNLICAAFAKHNIRFVTHLDFTDEMLVETENILKNLF